MQLAADSQTAYDLIAAWLAGNGAAWCHRMEATISHATCEENQRRSTHKCGDLRCHGCGGLDNQVEPYPERPALAVVWDDDKEPDEPPVAEASAGICAPDPRGGLNEDPFPADVFDDVELDIDEDEELLKLFPELAEDPWPDYLRASEYQTEAPRRAVYRGRCKRCGGYVEDTRERQDDNVFRCLACGWRTSPENERNRDIHAAGGRI